MLGNGHMNNETHNKKMVEDDVKGGTSSVHESRTRIITRRENIVNFLLSWSNLIALLLLVAIASSLSPYFLEPRNLFNVMRGASIIGIVAIGMTFVILNRGIDLSVGSIVGMATAIVALIAPYGYFTAVVFAVVASVVAGLVNGLLITRLKLQPFIATLASLIFIRGLVYIQTDGNNIILRDAPEWFTFIGSGYIGPVPVPIVIFVVIWLVSLFILKNTRFGRHVYAVGANENASRLYGIKINLVKLKVYAISGLLCGIAGVILVSRLTVSEPNAGQLYELDAIASTLIGGTTFDGGAGGVGGTLLGVMILALLGNILNLLGVSPYYQMLLQGGIIVVAVVVSEIRQRNR
jgi:ribose/xylose/arabinose/galactoside ABC-type transport system permease subunit